MLHALAQQVCSISKHSGALMSSRLMAPNEGSSAATTSMNRAGSCVVHLDVDGIDPGELLEQDGLALHHRLAGQCANVAQAQHGGAIGDDGDHVAPRWCSPAPRRDRRRWRRMPPRHRGNRPVPGRAGWPCAWSARSPAFPDGAEADGSPAPPSGYPRPSYRWPSYMTPTYRGRLVRQLPRQGKSAGFME